MYEAHKESLLRDHDLYQEFDANGRRYHLVFVVTNWKWKSTCQQPFLDPAVNWEKVFPGGKNLWPEGLHDPVQFAHKNMLEFEPTFIVHIFYRGSRSRMLGAKSDWTVLVSYRILDLG